jgi:hypothetical protein
MCEYLKLKIEVENLKSLSQAFGNLKTEMSEYWKLKLKYLNIENW